MRSFFSFIAVQLFFPGATPQQNVYSEKPESVESILCPKEFKALNQNPDYTVNCYLDEINLHLTDAIEFIILGPLAILFCLTLLFLFKKFPKLRKKPGDLMLGMTISELALGVTFTLSSARYFQDSVDPPKTKAPLCQAIAIVKLFFTVCHYLYNLGFCIFLYRQVRNVLKNNSTFLFHLISLASSGFFLLVMGLLDNFGKTIYGTCSINAFSFLFFWRPLLIGFYILLALAIVIYFKLNIQKLQSQRNLKKKYLDYYYKYLKIIIIIWGFIGLCDVVVLALCPLLSSSTIRIFLILGNISPCTSLPISVPISLPIHLSQYLSQTHLPKSPTSA